MNPLRRAVHLASGVLGLLVVGAVAGAPAAMAQLSPGPLAEVHAELEGSSNCLECHSADKGVDPDLCLSCHRLLGARIDAGHGLHARSEYRDCKTCHIDHHGREFELVWWGEEGIEAFDHDLAGWELSGAHRGPGCRECHRSAFNQRLPVLRSEGKDPERSFLGLSTECLACHRDEHRGQFPAGGCLSCHSTERWAPASDFDHALTSFPLTGLHRGTACEDCHEVVQDPAPDGERGYSRYTGLAYDSCADCHADDPHAGRLGPSCDRCHVTDGWQLGARTSFDHDRTRYPLRGSHGSLACEACHRSPEPLNGLAFGRCSDCHLDDHGGQFAARPDRGACESCHTVDGFVPSTYQRAEHDRIFALAGAHLDLRCDECHRPVPTVTLVDEGLVGPASTGGRLELARFRFPSRDCEACHRDPHGRTAAGLRIGAAGGAVARGTAAGDRCTTCHSEISWDSVTFDHRATGFALLGGHRDLECVSCHTEGAEGLGEIAAMVFAGLETTCSSCHDDRHQGQFANRSGATSCQQCHMPERWIPAAGFDHAIGATFALEGAHARVACSECHPTESRDGVEFVRYRPLATGCSDCHR